MTKLPPPRVVEAADSVRTRLQRLVRKMVPAPVALLEMMAGFIPAQAIYAVATLDIADVLAAGKRTSAEVADAIGADPDATYRLLRACVGWGLFTEDSRGRFGLTSLGELLCRDRADSIRPAVLMLGDPVYQGVWGQLPNSVRTGETGAVKLFGKSMWDHADSDPELAATFDDAMTCLSALDWPTVAAVYDFTRYSTIVDVGGGRGQLLAQLLSVAPQAKGVLFDRPGTVVGAEVLLRKSGVYERCSIESGSFFESVPAGGDLYVIRRFLHIEPLTDVTSAPVHLWSFNIGGRNFLSGIGVLVGLGMVNWGSADTGTTVVVVSCAYQVLSSVGMGVCDLLGYWRPRGGSVAGVVGSAALPALALVAVAV